MVCLTEREGAGEGRGGIEICRCKLFGVREKEVEMVEGGGGGEGGDGERE